jgi:hypothetical protein
VPTGAGIVGLGSNSPGSAVFTGDVAINRSVRLLAPPGGQVRFEGAISDEKTGSGIAVAGGTVTLAGPWSLGGDISVEVGALILDNPGPDAMAPGGVHVCSGASLTARRLRQDSLTIDGDSAGRNGTVRIMDSPPTLPDPPHGDNAMCSVLNHLAIANDGGPLGSRVYYGQLDLGNNDLVIHNSSVAEANATYWSVLDMLRSGYGEADWSGMGIVSSTALADPYHLTGVGVMINDQGDGETPYYEEWSGQTGLLATDVLVKFTFAGDSDLDGTVSFIDLSATCSGYDFHLHGWYNGDFDYDGVISFIDLDTVISGYDFQHFYGSQMPEPATGALVLLAAVLLPRRRKAT